MSKKLFKRLIKKASQATPKNRASMKGQNKKPGINFTDVVVENNGGDGIHISGDLPPISMTRVRASDNGGKGVNIVRPKIKSENLIRNIAIGIIAGVIAILVAYYLLGIG